MILRIYKDAYGFHAKIRLFNLNTELQIYRTYNTTQSFGITNNTPSGHRLIFCDYDEHLLEFIIPEIHHIQKKYHLSSFFIFKSGTKINGFHAICLDKLRYKEFLQIINETSADEYYRKMPIKLDQNRWILRTIRKGNSPAPKLIKIITSPYNDRTKSLAHYLYLKHQHRIRKKPKNLDKNKILYTLEYGTMNFVNANNLKNQKV